MSIKHYYSVLSPHPLDQAFAEQLYADLQNKNVRYWFAPHDIQCGKKIHEQIVEVIRVYDRLLSRPPASPATTTDLDSA
jgi:hypothetical protein